MMHALAIRGLVMHRPATMRMRAVVDECLRVRVVPGEFNRDFGLCGLSVTTDECLGSSLGHRELLRSEEMGVGCVRLVASKMCVLMNFAIVAR